MYSHVRTCVRSVIVVVSCECMLTFRVRMRAPQDTFFIIEVPKGHPQPGSPKDGPCKGPNEVRLNTECTRRVHSSRIVFSFFS